MLYEVITHQNEIETQLKIWIQNGANDLFTAAYLIAKFQYPETSKEDIRNKIEQLKNDVWLEINEHLTALEKVKIVITSYSIHYTKLYEVLHPLPVTQVPEILFHK